MTQVPEQNAARPEATGVICEPNTVDVLGVRFPRLYSEEAIALLLQALRQRERLGVCFPDMSTLNLAWETPSFRRLLKRNFLVLPDGAGVMWAALCRGKPLPENLNGTDLVPRFLAAVPTGTSVFLLGGRDGVAKKTADVWAQRFPHVRFVGHANGYFSTDEEPALIERLARLRPQVVVVGMGNPRQVEWIDRHMGDRRLASALFFAVGGQFDYFGGMLQRAPLFFRRMRLEWLSIVYQQPHKLRRYFVGIPLYLLRCAIASWKHEHDLPAE